MPTDDYSLNTTVSLPEASVVGAPPTEASVEMVSSGAEQSVIVE